MVSRRFASLLVLILSGSVSSWCQQLLPGTVFPVMLSTTVDSSKSRPGDPIRAKLMQQVSLFAGELVPAGTKIEGHVVEVSRQAAGQPARLVLTFDRIILNSREVPVAVNVRAIASMQEVFSAQLPTGTFDDYGTSLSDWTTIQVGGAVVFLGDSTLRDGIRIVGSAPGYGIVIASLVPAPKRGCPAVESGNQQEQSLWVFSPWACGVYGDESITIVQPQPDSHAATIELTSPKAVRVRSGSGWLLQVVAAPGNPAPPAAE